MSIDAAWKSWGCGPVEVPTEACSLGRPVFVSPVLSSMITGAQLRVVEFSLNCSDRAQQPLSPTVTTNMTEQKALSE